MGFFKTLLAKLVVASNIEAVLENFTTLINLGVKKIIQGKTLELNMVQKFLNTVTATTKAHSKEIAQILVLSEPIARDLKKNITDIFTELETEMNALKDNPEYKADSDMINSATEAISDILELKSKKESKTEKVMDKIDSINTAIDLSNWIRKLDSLDIDMPYDEALAILGKPDKENRSRSTYDFRHCYYHKETLCESAVHFIDGKVNDIDYPKKEEKKE